MGKVRSEKMFVCGLDGMDPRLTKKYVEMGIMPNTKKFIEAGAQRDDLVMLGGHPTVTPSMWTTLSRGCYSNVHGITCFWRQGDTIDTAGYNLDSRMCWAEAAWDCFVEAGKKTLVWHWPGCAWPPTVQSENLAVVDGVAPGVVGANVATRDEECIFKASEDAESITLIMGTADQANLKCVIKDEVVTEVNENSITHAELRSGQEHMKGVPLRLIMNPKDGITATFEGANILTSQSTIKPATGWANAPEGAKEMVLLTSKGMVRRPFLILQNENGVYDHVAMYKSKKETEPMAVFYLGQLVDQIVDDVIWKGEKEEGARAMKLLDIAEDGSFVKMYVSGAMSTTALRNVVYPASLYDELVSAGGYPPPQSTFGSHDKEMVIDCMLDTWKLSGVYQANCLNHCMNDLGYEVVFSHYHMIDLVEHNFIRFMSDKGYNKNPEEVYEYFMEEVYKAADDYIGQFLHLLDEDWTVFIVSDHAQVCPKHDVVGLGEMTGMNVLIMEELGLTALKRDENGNKLPEIDWDKTIACAPRGNQIYLNIKGRDPHGIIEPKDKYEWEEEIMTRLYGYKNPATGKRVVALALRNKDAVLLGMGGPQCGDIVYWVAEGYNADHTDSLSTTWGEADTSVSPIFIAAGKGLKQSFTTERIIRQIDLAPTMCILGNVRMPAQCEGAPVYQILEEGLEV
ncbi:MAG: alkaline phosphatase family protein [Peptococcaceae bacterium]|nr:alkaline phosphatase family protein [Peptococcaceae bacterium]